LLLADCSVSLFEDRFRDDSVGGKENTILDTTATMIFALKTDAEKTYWMRQGARREDIPFGNVSTPNLFAMTLVHSASSTKCGFQRVPVSVGTRKPSKF
jgi:hypothetical protein